MNKKTLVVLISVIAAMFVAAIAVFTSSIFGANGNDDPIANSKETPAVSSNEPSTTPSRTPTDKTEEEVKKEFQDTKKKELIKKDSVDGIDGFSKDEIQNALNFAVDYANSSQSNRYFLSGQWVEEGHKTSDVKSVLTPYFSKEILSTYDKTDKWKPIDYQSKVMPYLTYFSDNGDISPSPDCAPLEKGESIGTKICPAEINISEVEYNSVNEKGTYYLDVYFNTSMQLPVTINESGKAGETTVLYDYKLRLDRNVEEDGNLSYEIVGAKNHVEFSKVKEVE